MSTDEQLANLRSRIEAIEKYLSTATCGRTPETSIPAKVCIDCGGEPEMFGGYVTNRCESCRESIMRKYRLEAPAGYLM